MMDNMVHHDPAMMAEHMAVFSLVPHSAATHVAVSSGAWSDPSTWANGQVPGDDARVVIASDVHVTYDVSSEARLFTVRVDGHLEFATDADTKMVLDTMVVDTTGRLTVGTEDDPVPGDISAEIVIANNGPIDTDWDPMLLSRGIVSHGAVEMHGEEKASHLKVATDPSAGDTSITLAEIPENWLVGDTIVIAGTNFEGYKWDNDVGAVRFHETEDEVRTISHIEGTTVYFNEPLEHDHDAPREDLKTSVANYSRSISIETEDPETAEVFERGHVMFMHNDDVDVRYVEFHELGRTDKSERSDSASDFANITSDANVQGRYSVHLHRTGTDDQESPAILEGNAVFGSPGWGFVHHDSNAILHENASYDTWGAGFVAETGNETGAWTNNIAIGAEGVRSIVKNAADVSAFDLGRTGDGFWFQGRMVESSGNIAASVNHGFVYMHRGAGMPQFEAELFELPEAVGGGGLVNADDVPIRHFDDNEAFATTEGLHIVKANPNQGHDVYSHMTNFTAWNVRDGVHIEYTSHYILENFDIVAREGTPFNGPEEGISIGNNASDIVIINPTIEGFDTGIIATGQFVGDAPDSDTNFIVSGAQITNTGTAYQGLTGGTDRILAQTPEPGPFSIELGRLTYPNPALYGQQVVDIEGIKTDAFGSITLPSGTDSFDAKREEVLRILETDGYYTTSDGERVFILEDYYTDRLTGEVHKFGHVVYLNDGFNHAGMVYRGEIDLDNTAPVAADDSAQTAPETDVIIDLLANDTDPEGDPLSIDGILPPLHGEVFLRENGQILYRPDLGFEGEDTFEYWTTDSLGNFSKAAVTITVDNGIAPEQ